MFTIQVCSRMIGYRLNLSPVDFFGGNARCRFGGGCGTTRG